MEQSHAKYEHVYAIVRIDMFHLENGGAIQDCITIKQIVRSREVAEAEVLRLNQINGSKGAIYFWQTSRLVSMASEQGRKVR